MTAERPTNSPCRSCGKPFRPSHDSASPGPTSRHPFMTDPAFSLDLDDVAPTTNASVVPETWWSPTEGRLWREAGGLRNGFGHLLTDDLPEDAVRLIESDRMEAEILDELARVAQERDQARALVELFRAQRNAVLALHVPYDPTCTYLTCAECTHGCGVGDVEWPCPTVIACGVTGNAE